MELIGAWTLGLFGVVLAIANIVNADRVNGSVLLISLATMAGLAMFGYLIGRLIRWRAEREIAYCRRHPGEVYFSVNGLYVTGHYYPDYTLAGAKLEDDVLVFSRYGGNKEDVTVPVPAGQEKVAERVPEHLLSAEWRMTSDQEVS